MRKLAAIAVAYSLVIGGGSAGTNQPKAAKAKPPDYRAFEKKLSKDDKILHALERLTLGPRPGDLDAARRLGVNQWIEQQLHPESIPENPDLARRLEPLESLRISESEAARNYPSRIRIRQIAAGHAPMPDDPVIKAAVARLVSQRRSKKGMSGGNADMGDAPPDLNTLLSPEEVRTLRTGALDEKKSVLAAIPEDKMEEIAIAMPQGMRIQLMAAASPKLRREMMLTNAPQQLIAFDLTEGKLYRAILSNRQLAEQLDDFWFNHFNVFLDKGADRFQVPTYEREAIRPHVLGHFRDLLEATASSPAMLFYLDNRENAAPDMGPRGNGKKSARGLNENYSRELMELHTLGVDGGYTQKDVTEVARCFTGWTIHTPRDGGGFFFNQSIHDKGEKVVLGVTIPAGGGKEDGEKVLDILARHPSTARFISTKLAQRFIADDPPPKLIEKMAKTFRESNGDIRAVMKTMLTSNEFFSQGAYRAKVKSPFEMIVSAVRVTGADVDFAFPLANRLDQLGQPLYRKLEPTGYSNLGNEWLNSSALLARMNFALDLVQGKVPGVSFGSAQFSTIDPSAIARQLLLQDASPETRAAIRKALADQQEKSSPDGAQSGGSNRSARQQSAMIAGLLLGSPEFQKR